MKTYFRLQQDTIKLIMDGIIAWLNTEAATFFDIKIRDRQMVEFKKFSVPSIPMISIL